MKGGSSSSSKVIMGAAGAMVALVLALFPLLLAELYCSLFLRKRRHSFHLCRQQPPQLQLDAAAPSLCSFYAQGVVRAPRSFLFPAPENDQLDFEKQLIHDLPTTIIRDSSSPPPLICNPVYDDEDGDEAKVEDSPFETPGTLERGSSSGCTNSAGDSLPTITPMKKLPLNCPSVSLRDARSICTGSDSNGTIYTSSSTSPCTSPSWRTFLGLSD